MQIAYLVNQYPQPSQSFIRREIHALERHGLAVERFTARHSNVPLPDEADRAEQQRTRPILGAGAVGLLGATMRSMFRRPVRFARALALAIRVGRRSQRGALVHGVYLAEACVLLKWLEQSNIRHLHAHFGTNSTTVAMLCRELGGPPYSFTAHGPEEFDSPDALALDEKIRRADFVVAISEFGRSQLYRHCSHDRWASIHIAHCGLDEGFLAAATTPIPIEPRLVCVGRLSEQKGQLLLIEAAARLRPRESIST